MGINVINKWKIDLDQLDSESIWAYFKWCLANFDWYYHYSDDHRAWLSGQETSKRLLDIYDICLNVDKQKAEQLYFKACPWLNDKGEKE